MATEFCCFIDPDDTVQSRTLKFGIDVLSVLFVEVGETIFLMYVCVYRF